MNTALSIVNTSAWMKQTNTSSNIINTLNATLTNDIEPHAKTPILAIIKIMQVSAIAIA